MKRQIETAKAVISSIPFEAWIWSAGLFFLLFINPYQEQTFSICPLHNLGIGFCPGCGLGRSISFLYHGDFLHSLKSHPLGIAAFIIISYRVYKLVRNSYQQKKGEVHNA